MMRTKYTLMIAGFLLAMKSFAQLDTVVVDPTKVVTVADAEMSYEEDRLVISDNLTGLNEESIGYAVFPLVSDEPFEKVILELEVENIEDTEGIVQLFIHSIRGNLLWKTEGWDTRPCSSRIAYLGVNSLGKSAEGNTIRLDITSFYSEHINFGFVSNLSFQFSTISDDGRVTLAKDPKILLISSAIEFPRLTAYRSGFVYNGSASVFDSTELYLRNYTTGATSYLREAYVSFQLPEDLDTQSTLEFGLKLFELTRAQNPEVIVEGAVGELVQDITGWSTKPSDELFTYCGSSSISDIDIDRAMIINISEFISSNNLVAGDFLTLKVYSETDDALVKFRSKTDATDSQDWPFLQIIPDYCSASSRVIDTLACASNPPFLAGMTRTSSGAFKETFLNGCGQDSTVIYNLTLIDEGQAGEYGLDCEQSVLLIEENNLLNVFPNPVQRTLQISLSKENISMVQVVNLTGTVVLEGFGSKLDVSCLAKGMYLLRVQTQNGVNYNSKFIKN